LSEVIEDSGPLVSDAMPLGMSFQTFWRDTSPSFSFENEGDKSLKKTENHCPRYGVSCPWKTDILTFSFLHLAFVLWTNYTLQQM